MIEPSSDEDEVLERYASKWTALGYRLVKNPRGTDIPSFMGSYRPDAILFGPPGSSSENIIVEVLYKGQTDAQRKIEVARPLLSGHSGWRLEVLYAGVAPPNLAPTSTQTVRVTLARVEELDERDPGAFLMLWPVLEASARILLPGLTRRPQSAGRVVELLAAQGFISPTDADTLSEAAKVRNRLVHGDLDIQVTPEIRRATQRIVHRLVQQLDPPATAAE